jgi:PKD repeat protein
MAYNPATGATILFGGQDPRGGADGDTWIFQGSAWVNLTTSLLVAPPARWGGGFTYDARDGYLLLFGGRNSTQFFSDTWEFEGDQWVQLHPPSAPSPRTTSLAYDPGDLYVVMFGGSWENLTTGLSVRYSDTWTFNAGRWSALPDSGGPSAATLSPQGSGNLVDDPADGYLLDPAATAAGAATVWTFTNGSWSERPTNLPPPASVLSGSDAWDDDGTSVLLFGGGNPTVANNQTWLYRDGTWVNLTAWASPGPPARGGSGLIFDGTGNFALLFGGGTVPPNGTDWGDSWSFTGVPWPTVTSSVNPSAPEAGYAASFSALPQGGVPPYSAVWEFGDGGTSAGTTTTHAYARTGVFAANVSLTDGAGATAQDTILLTVIPGLSIHPFASPSPTDVGVTVYFASGASSGVPPYAVEWSFGDGSNGTGASVNHVFVAPGNFTANATVNDSNGGETTHSINVVVNSEPSVAVTAAPSSGCGGGTAATFTAVIVGGTAPYQVRWDFGDGIAAAGNLSTEHRYATSGSFVVAVTVTDAVRGVGSGSVKTLIPACSSGGLSFFVEVELGAAVVLAALAAVVLLQVYRRRRLLLRRGLRWRW